MAVALTAAMATMMRRRGAIDRRVTTKELVEWGAIRVRISPLLRTAPARPPSVGGRWRIRVIRRPLQIIVISVAAPRDKHRHAARALAPPPADWLFICGRTQLFIQVLRERQQVEVACAC